MGKEELESGAANVGGACFKGRVQGTPAIAEETPYAQGERSANPKRTVVDAEDCKQQKWSGRISNASPLTNWVSAPTNLPKLGRHSELEAICEGGRKTGRVQRQPIGRRKTEPKNPAHDNPEEIHTGATGVGRAGSGVRKRFNRLGRTARWHNSCKEVLRTPPPII